MVMIRFVEDVKPCPFCGGTKIVVQELDDDSGVPASIDSTYFSVWCSSCSATIASFDDTSEQKAIEHWNTRVKCGDVS